MKRIALLLPALLASAAFAQDRLPHMPRYDRFQRIRGEVFSSVTGGTVQPQWARDGKSFLFIKDGRQMRYDIATKSMRVPTEADTQVPPAPPQTRQETRLAPGRGRQYSETFSQDGSLRAFFKDLNVWISKGNGTGAYQITTQGNREKRTKFGQASWVYGEELEVHEAMWFSPDGKKLAYYGFDESPVPDYFVIESQTSIQDKINAEAYPKAGVPNPIVSLYVYDVASKKALAVDTRSADASMGEYVYDVRWSPDGKELLFNRTNRHQNHLQFCAANPSTGRCRIVVDENWSKTWTDNHPPIEWLTQQKFFWISERNGYRNVYMGDITGGPLKPITHYNFEVHQILGVDQSGETLYLSTRDGENPYKLQLHRIKFDGSDDKLLTDPHLSHNVDIAPDFGHFIDVAQDLTTPPVSKLYDTDGSELDALAVANDSKFKELGLKKAERIKFKAADGVTDLYGYMTFPSDFDPSKKYPLLISVYGGPESGTVSERFTLPATIDEMGFVSVWFDCRGTGGRGKAFKDAVYDKLGQVEIDDEAAGVRYLKSKPYVDGNRVGIFGTSYGGYFSSMCILRHPEEFTVAVSCSPVTDWRNYDSVYTERYMGLPTTEDNLKGYVAGAGTSYVQNLAGHLMLYYGTADNNVHPSNTLQLIQGLQRHGKSFDVQVGPDMGHSAVDANRMWEYFMDNLILSNK